MSESVEQNVAAAWIDDGGWIFSADPRQDGRYWIAQGWIWGPTGSANLSTDYWIADGWIYGPAGAADARTGFRIHENWIYGPRARLPFVPD